MVKKMVINNVFTTCTNVWKFVGKNLKYFRKVLFEDYVNSYLVVERVQPLANFRFCRNRYRPEPDHRDRPGRDGWENYGSPISGRRTGVSEFSLGPQSPVGNAGVWAPEHPMARILPGGKLSRESGRDECVLEEWPTDDARMNSSTGVANVPQTRPP